jgi:DNA-binding transcriptional MerR regulator
MSTQTESNQNYSIMEVARLSGLPESTLRYYETIGVIEPIRRDMSSRHRVYSEDDINLVISVACLSATGMSIGNMRTYLDNRSRGAEAADKQIALLEIQQERLATEAYYLKLRQRYVDTKIGYWKAVETGDAEQIETMKLYADAIAKELKLPKKFKEEG